MPQTCGCGRALPRLLVGVGCRQHERQLSCRQYLWRMRRDFRRRRVLASFRSVVRENMRAFYSKQFMVWTAISARARTSAIVWQVVERSNDRRSRLLIAAVETINATLIKSKNSSRSRHLATFNICTRQKKAELIVATISTRARARQVHDRFSFLLLCERKKKARLQLLSAAHEKSQTTRQKF